MNISYSSIGKNIRKARKNAGLTQEQAAEKLELSTLHYGRIERGQHHASLSQLAHIADVLNVQMETLLSGCIFNCSSPLLSLPDPQSAQHAEYALMLLDQFREQIQNCLKALKKDETPDS